MACASLQVMKTACSKARVGAGAGVWAWAAPETSSSAPAATKDWGIMSEFPVYLSLNGVADDVARRAADQAGADHRTEAAAGHQADAAAQGCAGDRAFLPG